jgi:hypothetical protein
MSQGVSGDARGDTLARPIAETSTVRRPLSCLGPATCPKQPHLCTGAAQLVTHSGRFCGASAEWAAVRSRWPQASARLAGSCKSMTAAPSAHLDVSANRLTRLPLSVPRIRTI